MVYASTGRMWCFKCSNIGLNRLTCPHKRQETGDAKEVVTGHAEVSETEAETVLLE